MTQSPPRGRRRLLRGFFIAAAAGVALAVVLHERILSAAGQYLIAADEAIDADVGFVLGGGRSSRADFAANLFEQNKIRRVLVSGAGGLADVDGVVLLSEQEILVRMLLALGVPEDRIERLIEPTASTEEEASALADYLTGHPDESVAIITNDIHTRRCRWIFSGALGSDAGRLQYAGCASGPASGKRWWTSADGTTPHLLEWIKLIARFSPG
jgi:uncharacterized SAM-binding protein YcdF (DUF218 family)